MSSTIHKRKIFQRENWKIGTVPNVITFARIGLVPFLIGSFFVPPPWGRIVALSLFLLASFTDSVDGYIARKYKQVSRFGAFLDPMADKLLVCITLLMLAGTQEIQGIHLIPAALIIYREIVISGLREFLGATGQELRVSKLAKYKTFLQMMALSFLVSGFRGPIAFWGRTILWISAVLTAVTGISYIRESFYFIKQKQSRLRNLIEKTKKRRITKQKKRSTTKVAPLPYPAPPADEPELPNARQKSGRI
jgi:cardiolipin synthase